jgi:hypothetical protein
MVQRSKHSSTKISNFNLLCSCGTTIYRLLSVFYVFIHTNRYWTRTFPIRRDWLDSSSRWDRRWTICSPICSVEEFHVTKFSKWPKWKRKLFFKNKKKEKIDYANDDDNRLIETTQTPFQQQQLSAFLIHFTRLFFIYFLFFFFLPDGLWASAWVAKFETIDLFRHSLSFYYFTEYI